MCTVSQYLDIHLVVSKEKKLDYGVCSGPDRFFIGSIDLFNIFVEEVLHVKFKKKLLVLISTVFKSFQLPPHTCVLTLGSRDNKGAK